MRKRSSSALALDLINTRIVRALLPMAFGFTGCAFGFISLCAYISLASETRIVPYVITVDRTGAVISRDDLKAEKTIPEAALASDLASFICDLRTVTEDSNLRARAVRRVYSRLRDGTQAMDAVEKYYLSLRTDEPRAQTDVCIENIIRVSDDSFQIDWSERSDANETLMRSHLTYAVTPDGGSSLDALKLNPLGVRVTAISQSQRVASQKNLKEGS